jgi:hypothetical protein
MDLGYTPLFFCTAFQKSILQKELPQVKSIVIPGYNIQYSSFLPAWALAPLFIFKVLKGWLGDRFLVQKLASRFKPELIIADHRYGFFSNSTKSIIVAHQIRILAPRALKVFENLGLKIHLALLSRFDFIVSPDFAHEGHNLSGRLSHQIPTKLAHKIRYGRPQTRFKVNSHENSQKSNPNTLYHTLCLLSGPEPMRTELENQILKIATQNPEHKFFLIRGTSKARHDLKIPFLDKADSTQIESLIAQSQNIICRSGYSTLMDLWALNRTALLIPTPGQTEQEYLAEIYSTQFGFSNCAQRDLTFLKIQKIQNKQWTFWPFSQSESEGIKNCL